MKELIEQAKQLGFETQLTLKPYIKDKEEINFLILCLIQKWLRDEKGVYLYVSLSGTKEITWFYSVNDKIYQKGSSNTYEQALEEGIKTSLKQLKV